MMQNATLEEGNISNKDIRTVEIEQDGEPLPLVDNQEEKTTDKNNQSTFGQDISTSDEDEISDVASFIIDQEEDDELDQELEEKANKFYLPSEGLEVEASSLSLPSIDPETHARLEALLEAAGIGKLSTADGKALTDPEVLRKLTSSVSCALDEAAQALHRMRAEQQAPESGRSLAEACSDGDVRTVRKLLHEGGSVHEMTDEGESLLSLACSAGYFELAQVLLAMKANVEDRGIKGDCTPLMEAASGGYVEIVKLLIAHRADVNAQSSAGNTPLHYAACGGYEDVVQVLIKVGANVEQHNENGHTPLMESASAGHVNVAKILLAAGAGINTHSNEFKESALTLACYKGHLDMVKFLLEAGADQEHKTDEMHTALMEASMDGHVEVAKLLLDSGAQVNMPADSFESPLTLAACGGHVELANLLIERGANLEEVNDEGYTPLMEAAREGHEEMVALILGHGADINAQTEETQETALTLACCGGFLEVADFLIKAGADIELGCSTPLMEAAQEGHIELVRYLLKKNANVRAQTGTGDTALTYACENGHTDVAEILLEHGAELEHQSEGGRTPLMKAARAGHLCTVQFLISKGANVNRTTSTNDHTVLSLSCAGGHLAVVELLLAQGADPAHKLKDGSTMIIEAAKGGHTQVVKLLLEYPNRVLMNSPEASQALDTHLAEARVPMHGLGNIVPPSDPDSSSTTTTTYVPPSSFQSGTPKKPLEKDPNWQTPPKTAAKRPHTDTVVKPMPRTSSQTNVVSPSVSSFVSDVSNSLQETLSEAGGLPDMLHDEGLDVKATARLEAIINNVMAKELDSASSKEEQILRKQQILQELQKVEKELQEKAQAQLMLSAQHQREHQQQQQLQQVLQHGAKVLQKTLEEQVKRKHEESLSGQAAVNVSSASGEVQSSGDSSVDAPTSNDLDKQVTNLYTRDVTASSPVVFPNIPYEGVTVTSSQQQPPPPPPPLETAGTDDGKDPWAKSNTSASASAKRNGNKTPRATKNVTTAAPPTASVVTSTSQVNGMAAGPDTSKAATCHTVSSTPNKRPAPQLALPNPQLAQALQQQQQQQQTQTMGAYPTGVSLTPEQQEQLLQMLSNPNSSSATQALFQQQFMNNQATMFPQANNLQLLSQQTSAQLSPQHLAQTSVAQQPLTQQQQQQLLQQQQKAQLLLQQQQQAAAAAAAKQPGGTQGPQKTARPKQRQLYTPQSGVPQGEGAMDNITPPPSTPLTPNPSPASPQSISPLCTPIDLDAQTESNHDTALTLACHGGHADLVSLLISKGADIEHRDKKGFTPLILAATAGHVDVVEILLEHGADMEAQSERTKDTPLSLACSGGRYEVVELLLSRGASKEHRNVSDYTPLSLAASGGYVNIIKLLLSHGAEINSRTGSKLGISPLMLAAMNGHTPAVKLLLDMGSDINAQIETNRNTALTLACFQGRHEVVSLLVDRKANIEHRAKTGLTPLMEAASGGYVEVGRVLLDKNADVNAPPVPSSRDTALTIAADKGHYRFVELLLQRSAAVDVKNKKGNSPLWLACNGGHLDVVQLLVANSADIDSQDNRKVSCLMAAFRKGHVKVVKWMVKHVNQFPSDQELDRYIATVGDKELQKKCVQCKDIIVSAKERQAAEAYKNASILLEQLDKERQHEENRKAAAAKKREKKKKKKKAKQKEKEVHGGKNSSPEPDDTTDEKDKGSNGENAEDEDDEEDDDDKPVIIEPPAATVVSTLGITLPTNTEPRASKGNHLKVNNKAESSRPNTAESKKNKRNRKEKEKKLDAENLPLPNNCAPVIEENGPITSSRKKKGETLKVDPRIMTGIGDLDDFGALPEKIHVERVRKNVEQTRLSNAPERGSKGEKLDTGLSSLSVAKNSTVVSSPKKGVKKDDGWKEVTRKPVSAYRSKKVQVPSTAISRVIGRGGCKINAIREASGALIEVEKQRGTSGERVITIKGSIEATKQAHMLILALVEDPDKDLQELMPKSKSSKNAHNREPMYFNVDAVNSASPTSSTPPLQTAPPKIGNWAAVGPRLTSGNAARHSGASSNTSNNNNSSMVWGGSTSQPVIHSPRRSQAKQSVAPYPSPAAASEKNVTRKLFQSEAKKPVGYGSLPAKTTAHTTVSFSYPANSTAKVSPGVAAFMHKAEMKANGKGGQGQSRQKPSPAVPTKMTPSPGMGIKGEPTPLPMHPGQMGPMSLPAVESLPSYSSPSMPSGMPATMYSPFSSPFSDIIAKKEEANERNFASVAAAGVASSVVSSGPAPEMIKADPSLQAKAPGFRAKTADIDPHLMGFDMSRVPFRGMPVQSPSMSPRSASSAGGGISPRGLEMNPSLLTLANQKEEYATPSQPMTLPKIESTLNPNAPNFTSRQPGQSNGPNIHPGYVQHLIAVQMMQQAAPGGIGGPGQNINISQADFSNLLSQLVASSSQAPGGPPVPSIPPAVFPMSTSQPMPPRAFSPLPPQARPSSAPIREGSPGPIGPPPSSASPLPATPPLQDQMKSETERRTPRPIGGERRHRAPGSANPMGDSQDFNHSWVTSLELTGMAGMQWNPQSTAMLGGAIPSSSVGLIGSNVPVSSRNSMAPSQMEDRVPPLPNHADYMDGPADLGDSGLDCKHLYYSKGMDSNPFAMQQNAFPTGPVGDHMWNPNLKMQDPVSDSDKPAWNAWTPQ